MNTGDNKQPPPEPPAPVAMRILARIEDSLLVLAVATMIILASTQIVLRNAGQMSIVWGDPALRALVLWVGLLGAMVASRRSHHINIDLLQRYLPPWAKGWARALTELFSAVVCGLVSYHSLQFVLAEKLAATEAFARVPVWIVEVIIPFGFAVMGLCALMACGHQLAHLLRK